MFLLMGELQDSCNFSSHKKNVSSIQDADTHSLNIFYVGLILLLIKRWASK